MRIFFQFDDHEDGGLTPLKLADALVNSENITNLDLEELVGYLSVYTRYNRDEGESNPYDRFLKAAE